MDGICNYQGIFSFNGLRKTQSLEDRKIDFKDLCRTFVTKNNTGFIEIMTKEGGIDKSVSQL